jgi:ParB-like chromosome segregation protein Spo0J
MTENVNKPSLTHGNAAVEKLIPYARNARVHTEEHVTQLAASIREFGFNNPVLIDPESNIIAGHGRVLAAQKLEMEEVPVIILSHFSEAQRRAFILADNKLHDNSSFDYEALQIELDDLKEVGFDLAIAGFEDFELNSEEGGFTAGDGYEDPDLGLPPGPDNYKEQYAVMVVCDSETMQADVYNKLNDEGYSCKVVTT